MRNVCFICAPVYPSGGTSWCMCIIRFTFYSLNTEISQTKIINKHLQNDFVYGTLLFSACLSCLKYGCFIFSAIEKRFGYLSKTLHWWCCVLPRTCITTTTTGETHWVVDNPQTLMTSNKEVLTSKRQSPTSSNSRLSPQAQVFNILLLVGLCG